eukprot:364786-Chlamydomonas_euryale.AAC.16
MMRRTARTALDHKQARGRVRAVQCCAQLRPSMPRNSEPQTYAIACLIQAKALRYTCWTVASCPAIKSSWGGMEVEKAEQVTVSGLSPHCCCRLEFLAPQWPSCNGHKISYPFHYFVVPHGAFCTGFDFVANKGGYAADCDGHGTHVASTAAGRSVGVAKEASIVAVRILDCEGSGTISDTVAAWADHISGSSLLIHSTSTLPVPHLTPLVHPHSSGLGGCSSAEASCGAHVAWRASWSMEQCARQCGSCYLKSISCDCGVCMEVVKMGTIIMIVPMIL